MRAPRPPAGAGAGSRPAGKLGGGSRQRADTRLLPVLLASAVLALHAACNPVTLSEARWARLVVDAPEGTRVQVLTSTNFAATQTDDGVIVDTIEADTTWYEAPAERTFDLGGGRRFYVEALEADPPDVVVQLTIVIDGRAPQSVAGVITEQTLRFIYLGLN